MKPIATDNYDFERLVTGGYAYVDKTDMLWKLANGKNGTLFFISRPRRFGKSLMLSTLKYLFQGKKKLFKGLKIEKKRWNWSQTYPVIELNMSDFDKEGTREGFVRDSRRRTRATRGSWCWSTSTTTRSAGSSTTAGRSARCGARCTGSTRP